MAMFNIGGLVILICKLVGEVLYVMSGRPWYLCDTGLSHDILSNIKQWLFDVTNQLSTTLSYS